MPDSRWKGRVGPLGRPRRVLERKKGDGFAKNARDRRGEEIEWLDIKVLWTKGLYN